MKKLIKIALGIFTSIGGFLEVGAIATAAQAGAAFRYQMIWALLLGTICVIFLVEMSGRLAAVSHHTIKDALRERFGPRIFMLTLTSDVDAAHRLFEELATVGIDYDDVTETLEREGVQKFIDSFEELLDGIRDKRGQLAAA